MDWGSEKSQKYVTEILCPWQCDKDSLSLKCCTQNAHLAEFLASFLASFTPDIKFCDKNPCLWLHLLLFYLELSTVLCLYDVIFLKQCELCR